MQCLEFDVGKNNGLVLNTGTESLNSNMHAPNFPCPYSANSYTPNLDSREEEVICVYFKLHISPKPRRLFCLSVNLGSHKMLYSTHKCSYNNGINECKRRSSAICSPSKIK